MPSTRGAFSQLLAPGLYAIIYDDLQMHPEEYPQYMNVKSTTRQYEEVQLVAGLGTVQSKPEGESIRFDDPIQGGTYRYTNSPFGLGFQVTREMWDDDQYAIMQRVSTDFAGSIRQHLETNAANVLNNAFTGGQATIDGVDLISTAHPLLGGGTYSNKSATNIAFSTTGMTEIFLLFEKMKNERGLLRRSVPQDLWISVDQQFTASEILHSSYKPYTGNNEVNVFQGRLTPHVCHYFSSSTAWFVMASKTETTLTFWWRVQPEFDRWDDPNTKGASFSVYYRFGVGAEYWHGIAGSPGA